MESSEAYAAQFNAWHDEGEGKVREGLGIFIKLGMGLQELKDARFKHGEWREWVEANCDFSLRTAQKCLRLAKAFPNASDPTLLGLSVEGALALLRYAGQGASPLHRGVPHRGR